VAVLKVNFRKHCHGEEKIARGDFAIQDTVTKGHIDLNADWDLCFFPGQRVFMTIIFNRNLVRNATCPKCNTLNPATVAFDEEGDIDW
jgi:hypothetical protein